jgi:pimeloyl-ACP methyl ester carboxylesterase
VSNGPAGMPTDVSGAHFARELSEIVWAGLLSPWGCTASGSRALLRLLGPKQQPTATPCLTPVVLVHGYGGNRTSWLPLELELRQAGFVNVHHPAAYNPLTISLPAIAKALRTTCLQVMEAAGSDHLHLIGHSLGGVVVRYAVQQLGLAADVRTAVTVAAPHRGTPVASLGWGPAVRALVPGSPVLEVLERSGDAVGVRWVAYYSDCDLIVSPDSARLDTHGHHALNVPVPDAGHLGILRAPVFLRSVRRLLLEAEQPTKMHMSVPGPALPRDATAA